ncbi:neural cell adhesion molecule L1 [Eublepharis macularius]|uniref:Neural cell adhesion molecule L1 n=1 Tax=Eublepharis macularius TaxID=481883 RepID=A0AA97KNU6_EUBMA|nr:neural cell adhesion molecule L1 [Eublepharis macularius]
MPSKAASLLSHGPLLVLLLCSVAVAIQLPKDLWKPPEFTDQPEEEMVVFPNDDIVLKCEATGNPALTFRWTKDGKEFDPQKEPGVTQRHGSGTLVISTNNGNAAPRFQGIYRCYASNLLGTAMSTESRIVAEGAPQWPKESVDPLEVEEGASAVLPCNPPISAFPPKIYWLNSRIIHITQNERVTLGQDGNLYFANVQLSDSRPDYICNAHFLGHRIIIQKEPLELRVMPTNSLLMRKPHLMLSEEVPSSYVALLGKTLILECIPEGLPTPTVEWVYKDGLMPLHRAIIENFNRTLRIEDVTEEDDGEYQCIVRNVGGYTQHTYRVTVEAAPYWTKKPVSHIYGPGENVRLPCEAYGKPKPEMEWRINGIPLKNLEPHPRMVLQRGALIISQVEPNDTAVMQCYAHNKHGSLLANAYIYVVRLPAQILTPDNISYSVVENQTAFLHCKTFGAPGPTMKWFTEDMYLALENNRTFEFTNGTLQLEQVQHEDAGSYRCLAKNDQNEVFITAHLIVKRATKILEGPADANKMKGTSVTFRCEAWFDVSIPKHGIKWQREGRDIKELSDTDKYFISNTTLTITNLDYSDQGEYNCVAWTSLDSVNKGAKLVVAGLPGPVFDLELSEQQERQVKLTWTPGDDHNSPITEYFVLFEESIFDPGQWHSLTSVPGNQPWTKLHLSPYGKYRFRVQAANFYGRGNQSTPSDFYQTSPAAPDLNPSGVKGEGNETSNMIITWKPLPPMDWNAPELTYHVQWRPLDEPHWNEVEVAGPPVVVTDTPTFSPYLIKVQSCNQFGSGPEADILKGYSGEDVPVATPENVGAEVINSTAIRLSWSLPNVENVRGHLKGFKVYYTWLGTMAERSRRQAHHHAHHHLEKRELLIEGNVSEIILGVFRPWSRYRVEMTVLNGKGEGPRSEAIEFGMPEGVPSRPETFTMELLQDMTAYLQWTEPKYRNGILMKYRLKYYLANQTANETEMDPIDIPISQHSLVIPNLMPYADYKFSLWAETKAGPGESHTLEGSTFPEAVLLSFENITATEVGENFTVIKWIPRIKQREVKFSVHIMDKTDGEPWHNIGKASSSKGVYLIPDLQSGKQYRIRFVKEHRNGNNETFWEEEVETHGTLHKPRTGFATEGWFIGFVSAIVLLVLVLVLLCFIKRSKGGKYSVKDKEDTQVDSEARPMKDETFGEYSDNEEKPFTSSQPSLNGDIKALGSDDSLADYGGSVDVQFNEDGSFIGQYSGQKGKEGGGNDSSGATSPTNAAAALE